MSSRSRLHCTEQFVLQLQAKRDEATKSQLWRRFLHAQRYSAEINAVERDLKELEESIKEYKDVSADFSALLE